MNSTTFTLKEEFIPLIQLLKFTGIAESGSMAAEFVNSSQVYCNGKPELRKRYKVRKGDVIQLKDCEIIVV